MKKKVLVVVSMISCLMLSALVGCGAKNSPKEPVTEFCESMKEMNFDRMAKTLIVDETENFEFEASTASEKAIMDLVTSYAKDIKYEIEEPDIEDNKATVAVTFTYKDCSNAVNKAMTDLSQTALEKAEAGETIEDGYLDEMFPQIMSEAAKNVEASEVSTKCVFILNTKDNEWKISEFDEKVITKILTANGSNWVDEQQAEVQTDDAALAE